MRTEALRLRLHMGGAHTAWRAGKEASTRGKEFGTIGESLLERALAMYLFGFICEAYVVLPLPHSQAYNLTPQIGQALIYVVGLSY